MKVVSLFSGCGGLDLGFLKAGADILWANDIDKEAAESYKKNIGSHIECKDIYSVDEKDVPDDHDIMIGGFPCLGFTIAKGKSRKVDDGQNFLYKQYLRLLEAKLPKYFLVENVPGMMSGKDFKIFFEKMLEDFGNAGKNSKKTNYEGYRIKHQVLLAADYGVPQKRKRVIIIGTRGDIEEEPSFPRPILREEEYITLKDAIGDLPEHYDESIPDHTGSKHKVKINNYIGNRKLKWDAPSPTILGRGSRSGGAVIHPHPNLTRRLSVRECARIQTFPDNFAFVGSNGAKFAQIGNAVPPLMSFFIALEFKKVIERMDCGELYPEKIPFDLPWIGKLEEILAKRREGADK